MTTFGKYNQ